MARGFGLTGAKDGVRVVACDLELETSSRNPNPRRLIADAACLPFRTPQ